MDRKNLQSLSRVDLQHKAMSLGLKANLKSDKLIEEILKVGRSSSATTEDNPTPEEGDVGPAPASRSTVTRARGASNKLESVSMKSQARANARRRVESPDETVPVKRVGRPATGRSHSRVVSVAITTTTEKPVTQRKTSHAARPLEADSEYKDSESDVEKEARTSASTVLSRIPTATARRQAIPSSKPQHKRKAVEIVHEDSEFDPQSSEDREKDGPGESKSRSSPSKRLSLASQRSAAYVEIRRSSGGDLPTPQNGTPSPTAKFVPLAKYSAKLPYEPTPSSTTASKSTKSPRRAVDKRTIISQVLKSEEYAALKSGLAESYVSIEKLKNDLESERARANRLESGIDAERAATSARESALCSRVEALETRPPPSPQASGPEPGPVSSEREKLANLETEFAAFKRETNGIIESHKATVSALDQHTRMLEARLNKLELAATPQVENPDHEIGTPPAPRIGKRDRNGPDVEHEDATESTPSTQPNPSKRPRFDEVEEAASPSPAEEPRQGDHDNGEEHDPAEADASKDDRAPTREQSHPDDIALGPGSETIDIDSIFVDAGASQDTQTITTINPAELTKPSPRDASEGPAADTSRPIAPLRRSSSSKESTAPKLVRTSALSFGQALKGSSFNPSFGPSAPGPSLSLGTPLSASTPAQNRDHAQALLSPEISFGTAPQFQPGFNFGNIPPNSPFPAIPLSAPAPAAPKPSSGGASVLSSPAFPADTGLRTSGDYGDFGTRNTNSDSTPPPSPSKRTMYGTELTTPLRQAFGVEATSRHLATRTAATANSPVPEGGEDMSIDETTSGAVSPIERRASPGDVFGANEVTTQQTTGVPSDHGSGRYGLENPLSWGGGSPRGL